MRILAVSCYNPSLLDVLNEHWASMYDAAQDESVAKMRDQLSCEGIKPL